VARIRSFLTRGLVLLLLLGGVGLGGTVGFLRLLRWYEGKQLAQAERALQKGDLRGARIWLDELLHTAPDHPLACRLMADVQDASGSPDSLQWRRRAVQAAPESLHDRLLLALSALRHGNLVLAQESLKVAADPGRRTAFYQSLAAWAALSARRMVEAEGHFEEAVQLDPADPLLRLNLAMMQLRSPVAASRAEGLATLERLRLVPAVRVRALRALFAEAGRRRDWDRALALGAELQADAAAVITDRLAYLDLLKRRDPEAQKDYLARLQERVGAEPSDAAQLIHWMKDNVPARNVLRWCRGLPPATRADLEVTMATAEVCVKAGDWDALQSLVKNANWGRADHHRLALLARVLREQKSEFASGMQWNAALKSAGRRPEALHELAELADAWGWDAEAQQALWTLARGRDHPEEALSRLYERYQKTLDTQGLYRVLARTLELNPENVTARNHFALLSLLLKLDVSRARATARELHEREPTNPHFAATYAYALHVQGRTAEAVRVMDDLQPEQLAQPAIAAYYGLILAGAGQSERATHYLLLAGRAALLPEEKALVTATLQTLTDKVKVMP
jgi:Flp pilus assembly protein TadD